LRWRFTLAITLTITLPSMLAITLAFECIFSKFLERDLFSIKKPFYFPSVDLFWGF
jgi:hypothetical protein